MTFPDILTAYGHEYVPQVDSALPAGKTFARVLHELELASSLPHTTPPDRPEVRALFPNHFVLFDEPWQKLAWDMNPMLSAGNMTQVYDYRLWIANNNGFGDDLKPRANHFLNTNLNEDAPRVEALTCGGNLLSIIGETVTSYIIETLDYHKPVTLDYINARPWFQVWAVNMGTDGTPRRFSQGKQPNGYIPGVRHPFVADPVRFIVTIPKWRVVKWTQPYPPDPYRIYLLGA